ncbi:class I SAM-dependent methyltransferase [Glycocaulis sp.]
MTVSVQDRHAWALERLNPAPGEVLLEAGCGHGILLGLIAARLDSGHITGLDRSAKMIAAAAKRNADLLANGRIRLVEGRLEAAPLGDERFDRVIAARVNAFWLDPAPVLSAASGLLRPGGTLELFFDPPDARKLPELVRRLEAGVSPHGFVSEIVTAENTPWGSGLHMTARPAGA